MEGAFALAKKTYRDNFLQYKLTNEPKYKNAYEKSMESIETMLDKLGSRPIPQQIISKPNYLKEDDSLQGAILRQTTLPPPSMTWKYVTVGCLSVLALGLMSL
jgi:hypothetical protein